jgi:hypothetical protein
MILWVQPDRYLLQGYGARRGKIDKINASCAHEVLLQDKTLIIVGL